jgi:hypothetical protein
MLIRTEEVTDETVIEGAAEAVVAAVVIGAEVEAAGVVEDVEGVADATEAVERTVDSTSMIPVPFRRYKHVCLNDVCVEAMYPSAG